MQALLPKIGAIIAGIGLTIGGWFGFVPDEQTGAPVQPFGGQEYTLAGNGVTNSATSLTLQTLTIPQSGQKISDSDLSSTFFLTLEPGNRTKQEIVSCTTVTQNSGGTATLSGCARGLSPIPPYTASTTLSFVHAGGSKVVFSNPPQLYNQFAAKTNDELIPGLWTASSTNPWRYDADFSVGSTTRVFAPANWVVNNFLDILKTGAINLAGTYTITNATSTFNHGLTLGYSIDSGSGALDVANKSYVDAVAVAGASDANLTTKGIVEEATVAEIDAGTLTGGTGAKLFATPTGLASSIYASSTTYYFATTTAGRYLAKTLTLNAGDVVFAWTSQFGTTNAGNAGYRISSPWSVATTTIFTDTSIGDNLHAQSFVFQATTTSTVTFEFQPGGSVYSSFILEVKPRMGFSNQF